MLKSMEEMILREWSALKQLAWELENSGTDVEAMDIVSAFERFMEDYRLGVFMHRLETGLRGSGRVRTAQTYRSAFNSLRTFLRDRPEGYNGGYIGDLHLLHLTPDLMQAYEGWMRRRSLVPNSISFYMRILRAVYNQALEDGMIQDCQPFRRVYTGVERTVKRALPIRMIRCIRELNLSDAPELAYARDMFMLSFYLRGMSLVDMSFLRKTDLVGNCLTYRRRKTGQLLTVRWTKEMQEILQRYEANESEYLLPIIRRTGVNGLYVYRHACRRINCGLKHVAVRAGFRGNLTMYVARHSWASAARSKGIPVSVISEGMGHDSESTTRIYLAELDSSVVDRANAVILKALG